MLFRRIRAFDRSPWLLRALLVLLPVAGFLAFPLAPEKLIASTWRYLDSEHIAKGRVFSITQDRPFEINTRFEERYRAAQHDLETTIQSGQLGSGLTGALAVARLCDKTLVPLFLSPESDGWEEDPDSYVWYQVIFSGSAPSAWLLEALHLSPAWIVVAWHFAAWLGLLSIFLCLRRLLRSSLLTVAGLGGACLLVVWLNLSPPPSVLNVFTVIYIGQLLAASDWPARLAAGRGRLISEAALLLALGAEGLLTLFTPPLQNSVNCMIVAGLPIVLGLLTFRTRSARILVLRGVAALIVLFLFLRPYNRYCTSICQPVSSVNHGHSEAYTSLMLWLGTYERPTWLGTPNGDIAFDWAFQREPLLLMRAPWLVVHQGFPAAGRDLVAHTLRHRPLLLAEAMWKRIAMQILAFDRLNFQSSRGDRSPLLPLRRKIMPAGMVLALLMFVWLLGFPRLREVAWPPLAIALWQCFGINTIFTFVHTHQMWQEQGFAILACLLTGLALFSILEYSELVRQPVSWLIAHRARRIVQVGALCAALTAAPTMRYAWKESAKEWRAMDTWLAIHFGAFYPGIRKPKPELVAQFETLKALGENEPGAVEMFAAQHFCAHFYTNDAEARALARAFYERALRAAPKNSNFASYAPLIGDSDWPAIYARALASSPDHPYAAYMAFRLWQDAGLVRYAAMFEERQGQLWARTADLRPGYMRLPDLGGQPQVVSHAAPDGLLVSLPPHQQVRLPDFRTYGAPSLKVMLYVRVIDGGLVAHLRNAGELTPRGSAPAELSLHDPSNYRMLEGRFDAADRTAHVLLEAGPQGARFTLRDYYPLLRTPRLFRRAVE